MRRIDASNIGPSNEIQNRATDNAATKRPILSLPKRTGLDAATLANQAPRAGAVPTAIASVNDASVVSVAAGLAELREAVTPKPGQQVPGSNLVPLHTPPRADLPSEVTGHVRRKMGKRGDVEVTFYPDERKLKPLTLEALDAVGIAEGGRVTLKVSATALFLDTKNSEAMRSIVGRVERQGQGLIVVAADPTSPLQRIPLDSTDMSLVGKTVLAHVVSPLEASRIAKPREVYDSADVWRINFMDIAVKNGVEATFSDEALAEIEKLKTLFDPSKIQGRVDLTGKDFITVDNPYSKDFDQAMYDEPSREHPGAQDVYYAIADISYFFELLGKDSAVAERARRLQTTTYMPGVDAPILHRVMSEDLTSLIPNAVRPAIVFKFTVGKDGEVIGKPEFIDATIKSRAASSYNVGQDYLDGKVKLDDPVLKARFDFLKTYGGALLEKAKARGMLSSGDGETWANIDPKTHDLVLERRGQRWIEEANAQVSITTNALGGTYLFENKAPAFHRVHRAPDEGRILLAREAVKTLGVDWPKDLSASEMIDRLDRKDPKYRAVRKLLIRAAPRAVVSAEPESHDGLKLAHYVQQTAPMRRERDGRNHTFIRAVRDGKTPDVSRVEEVLSWSTIAQDRDSRVNRAIDDCISAKALEPLSGKTVKAQVVSVSPRGFEVYVPEANIERFVPVFGRDNRLDANGTVLHVGGDHPYTLTLCDEIEVRIDDVQPLRGKARITPLGLEGSDKVSAAARETGAAQPISAVRGNGYNSPLVGKRVSTEGVVTAVNAVGFWIQPLKVTSVQDGGGLFIRTRGARVAPGDTVTVDGTVRETRDKFTENARPTVEITDGVQVNRTGKADLPPAVDLSKLGPPPADNIGAAKWYGMLMGQRVVVNSGIAVAPMSKFGDAVFLPEGWDVPKNLRSNSGGILQVEGKENFTRVSMKFRDAAGAPPQLYVGAKVENLVGVFMQRSGDPQVELIAPPTVVENKAIEPDVTTLVSDDNSTTVATLNVLNLDPFDTDELRGHGHHVVENLRNPDIIALQEVQDNDGAKNTDVVAADKTYAALIQAIRDAGGPEYAWVDRPPVDDQDGGEPGGNIRCGYLYRKDRVEVDESSVRRIGEGNPAFIDSRKSLVAVFKRKGSGQKIGVINNHWASKKGSSPPTGEIQPPINGGEEKRLGQADAVGAAVADMRKADPEMDVVSVGDGNTSWASAPARKLKEHGLRLLTEEIVPEDDRYDYTFRGTQQVLCPTSSTPEMVNENRVQLEPIHNASVAPNASTDHDGWVVLVKRRA